MVVNSLQDDMDATEVDELENVVTGAHKHTVTTTLDTFNAANLVGRRLALRSAT